MRPAHAGPASFSAVGHGGSMLAGGRRPPAVSSGKKRRKKRPKVRATFFSGLMNAALDANGDTAGAEEVINSQSVLRPKAGTVLDKSYGITLTWVGILTAILLLATAIILTIAFVKLAWGLIALMGLLILAPIVAYAALVDASRGGRPGCATAGIITVAIALLYAVGFTIYTAVAITYVPENCAADSLCRADGTNETSPVEEAGQANVYYLMLTWFPAAWAIVASIVYIWVLSDTQTSQERLLNAAKTTTAAQALELGV